MIRVSVMYPGGEGKKFDFQKASQAHGKELFADVPNFTNIAPQVQIAEVIHPS